MSSAAQFEALSSMVNSFQEECDSQNYEIAVNIFHEQIDSRIQNLIMMRMEDHETQENFARIQGIIEQINGLIGRTDSNVLQDMVPLLQGCQDEMQEMLNSHVNEVEENLQAGSSDSSHGELHEIGGFEIQEVQEEAKLCEDTF